MTARGAKGRGRVRRAAGIAFLAVVIAWFSGFLVFARVLQSPPPEPAPRTDGIVVLTGDRARLVAGLDLLARRQSERLLITGVNPATRPADLAKALPVDGDLLRARVDLGRQATNTAGNAREAAEWAARRGYHSLTIVTAGYHMPRSIVEFRRHMPDMRLVPHPVFPEGIRLRDWWRWPGTSRVLLVEYHKYLASRARAAVAPAAPVTSPRDSDRPDVR